jgi:HSP20 family molecular chaperone IbpA
MEAEPVAPVPPVDIYETDDRFVTSAKLRGVRRRNFCVKFEGSGLSILSERQFESTDTEES